LIQCLCLSVSFPKLDNNLPDYSPSPGRKVIFFLRIVKLLLLLGRLLLLLLLVLQLVLLLLLLHRRVELLLLLGEVRVGKSTDVSVHIV
jgi:hypothetical protein